MILELSCTRVLRRWFVSTLLVLCLAGSPALKAAEIEGVSFSNTATVAGTSLELTSLARLYYRLIFTGAVVGLYLDQKAHLNRLLSDVPKRLEFVYFGSLQAEDFVDAANESLAENLDPETLNEYRRKIDAFNSLYVDIKKHDRYAISHVPGHGLQLALNGKVLGQVEGDDFAAAYFNIWFGDNPFNNHLKTSLLEGDLQSSR